MEYILINMSDSQVRFYDTFLTLQKKSFRGKLKKEMNTTNYIDIEKIELDDSSVVFGSLCQCMRIFVKDRINFINVVANSEQIDKLIDAHEAMSKFCNSPNTTSECASVTDPSNDKKNGREDVIGDFGPTNGSTYASKKKQTKQVIKQNKENRIACCPKCGSTSLSANKRGWKVTTGFIGSSKIIVTCLSCGNKFKPGK